MIYVWLLPKGCCDVLRVIGVHQAAWDALLVAGFIRSDFISFNSMIRAHVLELFFAIFPCSLKQSNDKCKIVQYIVSVWEVGRVSLECANPHGHVCARVASGGKMMRAIDQVRIGQVFVPGRVSMRIISPSFPLLIPVHPGGLVIYRCLMIFNVNKWHCVNMIRYV